MNGATASGSVRSTRPAGPNDSGRTAALVVGASAGGLEALRLLVPSLPLDEALYAVVAVHLSPTHRSMLSELLGRDTAAPVLDLSDGLLPRRGHVYVVPPGCQPRMEDGCFRLSPSTLPGVPKPSIDALMLSMAEALGEAVIAVVLSGTGSDGSRGVRAVRAHGGLVLVQEPADARYDSMPLHAIETRVAHHIAPAAALGAHIRQLLSPESLEPLLIDREESDELAALVQAVRTSAGFDLGAYKPTTLKRRVARRMRARACHALGEYRAVLVDDPEEAQSLVKELLISVTSFFRDPAEFEALAAHLGNALDQADLQRRELRIWVAGCATGEEAYTMALIMQRLLRAREDPPRVRIFATDIDAEALELARRGVYPAEALGEIPQDWRTEDLLLQGDLLRIGTPLREMVIFSQHNLLRDPPFLRLDVLACRNVLIYLQPDWQRWLLRHFQSALGEQGVLMLGRSETPCADDRLEHVRLASEAALFGLRRLGSFVESRMPALAEPPRANPPRRHAATRQADLGQLLLAAHSAGSLAPGWVMTDQGQLQHTFGDVSPLLQLQSGGPATLDVAKLCEQRLWLELRSLVFQARQKPGTPVASWMLRSERQPLRLSVLCLPQQALAVVMFSLGALPGPLAAPDAAAAASAEAASAATLQAASGGASTAEHELVHLREHVTATQQHLETLVSELDAANEELQLLNEELQSSNEELQSTNEELATSNEELQSTNEELITVNEELQMRTTELALRNADLDNVRNSLLDPLVVVDENARVVLRNAAAEALWDFGGIGTLHSDRPLLAAVPCRFTCTTLLAATRDVLDKGLVVDLELPGPGVQVFALRVQPYLGRQGERCGAVLVLRDMTEAARLRQDLTATAQQLSRSEALRRATVDALPDLICVLDDEGRITGVNAAWEEQARVRCEPGGLARMSAGASYVEACTRAAAHGDAHALRFLQGLASVQTRRERIFELTYPCHAPDSEAWFHATVTPLDGSTAGVVVRHQDVTEMHVLLARLQLQARALDASPNGIVVCEAKEPGYPVIYVNKAFQTLTGYSFEEIRGRSCSLLQGSDRQQAGLATLRQALAERQPVRVLLRNYRKSGEMYWNELTVSMVSGADQTVTHMVGVQRDVTTLLASEEALRASQRREAQALLFAGIGSIDWRLRDGLLTLSQQQARLLGLGAGRGELSWDELRQRIHAEDRPVVEDAVKVCVAGHAPLDIEFRLRMDDGAPRWLHLQGNVERDATGLATHVMAICQDITARRAAEDQARFLSQHDGLTGLPNRSLLRDRLQHAVLQAVRERSRLALLFIDLDRFKEVNDTMGHDAGDELLQTLAERLRHTVRDSDTVGRLGGDEFVVLLPQLHSAEEAGRVAEKLLQCLQEPLALRGTTLMLSASIGVSLFPDDGQDGDELMRHADSAMYRAKGSGRNAVCFFSHDTEHSVHSSLVVRTALKSAVVNNELVLHYQPQIDLQTGRLCGMEALLRWAHPSRGQLMPCDFLAALDDPTLAERVGEWVLAAACEQARRWQRTVLAGLVLSVNITPWQLRGDGLVRNLNKLLGRTGLRPEMLELEVTENALVDARLGAVETIRDCRQLGVGIALDDFGVGFSSLSLLHQHPISRIKIDQSFCRQLPGDHKSAAIVRAMIDMARNLSIGVVAEGIETEAQAQFLLDAGCTQVQGYLYARPGLPETIESWWQRQQTPA